MTTMNLLLCLLPVLAHAQITINIQASKSTTDASLQATGASETVITTQDEKFFNITDSALKNAVLTLTGRIPTNVFLRGPTPWNDLYKTYGWKPVKKVTKPHKLKVINVETNKVILNKIEITNEESVEKNQDATLNAKVENTVTSSWSQNDVFATEIKYNIDVTGLGKVPKFELNSTFGENLKESKVVSMKSASVKFALKPKSVATVVLTATKVKVAVEVEYWIMLAGYVATNNEVKLNGHHFWAYDARKVLMAASLPDMRKVKEVITVEFYTDDNIVVN